VASKKRVGVIGSFVWDVIHGRDPRDVPVEEWGGITYALSAFDAALGADWEFVPVLKVGSDLAQKAREFVANLDRRAPGMAPIEVPYPNNRVHLYYQSDERRCEMLSGGVPGWTWVGLKPLLAGLDALYINLISGFELDLEVAQLIRQNFSGPIYCDLHSLLLAIQTNGMRTLQPLPNAIAWMRCFDFVQVNEDEMHRLGNDPMVQAASALGAGVSALIVTLGAKGSVYFTRSAPSDPLPFGTGLDQTRRPILSGRIPAPAVTGDGDPTGCGDAFGATLAARLFAGEPLEKAIADANATGARNFSCRGAGGLLHSIRGGITVP